MEYNMMPPPLGASMPELSSFGSGNGSLSSNSSNSLDMSLAFGPQKNMETINEEDIKPSISDFTRPANTYKPVLAGRANVHRPPPLSLQQTYFEPSSGAVTTAPYHYSTEQSPHHSLQSPAHHQMTNQHLQSQSGRILQRSPHVNSPRVVQSPHPMAPQLLAHPSSHVAASPGHRSFDSPHPHSATPHSSVRYTFDRGNGGASHPGTPFSDQHPIQSPMRRVHSLQHQYSVPSPTQHHYPSGSQNPFQEPVPSPHHTQPQVRPAYNEQYGSPHPYNNSSPHTFNESIPQSPHFTQESINSPLHYNTPSDNTVHGGGNMIGQTFPEANIKREYRSYCEPGTPFTNPSHPGTPAYVDSPRHGSPHPQASYQHFFGPNLHLDKSLMNQEVSQYTYSSKNTTQGEQHDALLGDRGHADTLLSAINMKQEHHDAGVNHSQDRQNDIIMNAQAMDTEWQSQPVKSGQGSLPANYNIFEGSDPADVDELLQQTTDFTLSLTGGGTRDPGKALKTRVKGRPGKTALSPRAYGAQCPICGKNFNNSSALAKHKLTHSDERKYVCELCAKAFKRQDHLNGHMMTHRTKKPFECSFDGCAKSYCDARSLRRHLENHHNVPSDTLFDMTLPGYGANDSAFGSAAHHRTSTETASPHASPVTYAPGPGGPVFRLDSQSSQNSIRDLPKPTECTVCGKRFKNLPALNGHMRLHGGYQKPDQSGDQGSEFGSISSSSHTATSSPRTDRPLPSRPMDKSERLTKSDNPSQGNVRQGDVRVFPGFYSSFPSPAVANSASLLTRTSPAPFLPSQHDISSMAANAAAAMRAYNSSIMQQMQHRMPYLAGSQLFPPLLDTLERPDKLPFPPISASLGFPGFPASLSPYYNSEVQSAVSHSTSHDALSEAGSSISRTRPNVLSRHELTPSRADREVNEIYQTSLKQEPMEPEQPKDRDDEGFRAQRNQHTDALDSLSPNLTLPIPPRDQNSNGSAKPGGPGTDSGSAKPGGPGTDSGTRRRRMSADQHENPKPQRHRHRSHQQGMTDALAHSDGAVLFRSPQPVATKKKKARPEPLVIAPNLAATQSRLRSPRIWEGPMPNLLEREINRNRHRSGRTPPPYTPPPILSPLRTGTGLFYGMYSRPPHTPLSASLPAAHFRSQPVLPDVVKPEVVPDIGPEAEPEVESDPPPPIETDIKPHINVGPNHQAVLPQLRERRTEHLERGAMAQLLWTPDVLNPDYTDQEVKAYVDFACSAAVPGSGSNKEYALHQLFYNNGDLMKSVLCMMERDVRLEFAKFVRDYHYQDSDVWSTEDIENFTDAIMKSDKDFNSITTAFNERKSHKQCIEFYYLWKKICPEEYKRLRTIRSKKRTDEQYNLRPRSNVMSDLATESAPTDRLPSDNDSIPSVDGSEYDSRSRGSVPGSVSSTTSPRPTPSSSPSWFCQFPTCAAFFTSKQALAGHLRIHDVSRPSSNQSSVRSRDYSHSREPSPARKRVKAEPISGEEFPCKLCGKVFYKVKSRSAHMKSHSVLAKKSKDKSIPT